MEVKCDSNDLELAAKIHYSYLLENYSDDIIDSAVKAKPFNLIGGDYCSILPVSENRTIVSICDAVGHGIAAALFAARVNTFVLSNAPKCSHPCDLICKLNEFLCKKMQNLPIYTTFFVLYIDSEKRVIYFAGAAHPPVIIYSKASEQILALESETTLLGMSEPLLVGCQLNQIKYEKGDRIILYTDGLSEASKPGSSQFGIDGISNFLVKNNHLSLQDFNEQLVNKAEEFSEGSINDDILLMTLQLK